MDEGGKQRARQVLHAGKFSLCLFTLISARNCLAVEWLIGCLQFGLGYAACPGINLAKIEMSKLAASIVRDYDIRQVNPKQEWSYEAYFNTLPHDWPVLVTKVQ